MSRAKKGVTMVFSSLLVAWLAAGGYLLIDEIKKQGLLEGKNAEEKIEKGKTDSASWQDTPSKLGGKKISLARIDRSGDYFFIENQLTLALQTHLLNYQLSQKNPAIAKKIALIYFQMKEFKKASEYFDLSKSSLNEGEKELFVQSLMFSGDLEWAQKTSGHLTHKDKEILYKTLVVCEVKKGNCEEDILLASGSGEVKALSEKIEKMNPLKKEDPIYRQVLIMREFMELGAYSLTISMGERILEGYPTYASVIKLMGHSFYELGRYEDCIGHLKGYFEKNSSDKEARILLGLAYLEVGDMSIGSIILEPVIEELTDEETKKAILRKLIWAYGLLKEENQTFKHMHTLLALPNQEKTDLLTAIFLAVDGGRASEAKSWLEEGKKKYPKEDNIEALEALWEVMFGDVGKAKEKIDPMNITGHLSPIKEVVMALYEKKSNNTKEAREWFEKAEKKDKNMLFGKIISFYKKDIQ